jgi:outer membrane receptor protein involved in Fe transport
MTSQVNFKRKSVALAVASATLSAIPAMSIAQEDVSFLEEIVVTATARATSVQEIPYNISAVQGDDMEARMITDQNELLRSIPGVTIVDKGHRNSGIMNQITIRGLNTNTGSNGDMAYNSAPTVSTYVGSTPLFANFVLKDIDRVEVLRGPQGTLYGSGNLGGTVRYIPNRPSTEAFSAKISGDLGQTDGSEGNNLSTDIVLNMPLSDSAALRINAGIIDNDGVTDYDKLYTLDSSGIPIADPCFDGNCNNTSIDDTVGGGPVFTSKEDADTTEISYARASLAFDLNENASVLLSYQHQSDEVGARRGYTPFAADDGTTWGEYSSGRPQLEPSERTVDLMAAELEWDMGFATMTANVSNYKTDGVGYSDNTGFYAKVSWGGLYMAHPRPFNLATRGYEDEATVAEFRLVSSGENFIDWTVGMFTMTQDYKAYQDSTVPGWVEWAQATTQDADPDNDYIDGVFTQGLIDYYVGVYGSFSQSALGKDHHGFWQAMDENDFHMVQTNDYEETTFYGEATVNFSEDMRLTVGARAFDNELTAVVAQEVRTFPAGDGNTNETVSDNDVIGKINLSYDFADSHMVYGTVSEGYRRGGANGYPTVGFYADEASMFSYASDKVTNVEVGIKGTTDDFRYTIALFQDTWDAPQLNTIAPSSGVYIVQNGDEAETSGIEFEIEGYLSEALHYSVGYSYVDAELTTDFYRENGSFVAAAGNTLPGVAENTFNFALDYTVALDNGYQAVYRVGAYYQSETENSINNDSELYGVTFDAFSMLDASASLMADKWTATLYAKNLSNEEGTTAMFKNEHMGSSAARNLPSNNSSHAYIATPRTMGLAVSYSF